MTTGKLTGPNPQGTPASGTPRTVGSHVSVSEQWNFRRAMEPLTNYDRLRIYRNKRAGENSDWADEIRESLQFLIKVTEKK